MSEAGSHLEWLEADGLGGFASGTISGLRTRRYHALLLSAARPPTGRFVLVNGFDAEVKTPEGAFALSSNRYPPDVVHPDGYRRIERFDAEPWPRWTFALEDGTRIVQEIFAVKGSPITCVAWRVAEPPSQALLSVRPFLSGRDYHALHHENPAFRFEPKVSGPLFRFSPYEGVPDIILFTNGQYHHDPDWYRSFVYEEERARGLDDSEDLASPGTFRFDLLRGEAILILQADRTHAQQPAPIGSPERMLESLRSSERARRQRFESKLHRASDAYVVSRGGGKTIIAGYPWFTDWGRDTFISMRGLCLATGRFEDARGILREWARLASNGMLPNRFPDQDSEPEYNSVDASLWFVVAVHELLRVLRDRRLTPEPSDLRLFNQAIGDILAGYAKGTRHGIRLDDDGLIACGEPGLQLTWMDAKIGDWVVTPRIGKPVEIQALWLNALRISQSFSDRWNDVYAKGLASFERRFWDETGGYLYDVVDADHERGKVDRSFRPNQIYAIGGLPFPLLGGRRAQRVVANIEKKLLTPVGLRTLAPDERGYVGRYRGPPHERDAAYHQGTVWPYLLGPFVEAWVRANGMNAEAKSIARDRFLAPLLARLETAGLGHLFEIADGDPPHAPKGCPFQAWSVGEAVRLACEVLRI
jgi:predicted glycogen debranching enzyme